MQTSIPKNINNSSKEEKYILLKQQAKALLEGENNIIANMANLSALIKEIFNWFWVGFYISDENGDLVLGPFQGPIACTRISFGKGVCGQAAQQQKVIIVSDVDKYSGHISCNSNSKSEIVVPYIKDNKTQFVLDIDNDLLNSFNATDSRHLSEVVQLLSSE